MSPRAILILCFGIGVALETLYLIRADIKWGQLGACVGIVLFGIAVGLIRDRHPNPVGLAMGGFAVFVFAFAVMFQAEVLPVVTETLVLAYTLIFWYGLNALYPGGHPPQLLLLACALPTLAAMWVALARPRLGFPGKLLLYSWFLVMVVVLAWWQLPWSNLAIFEVRRAVPWLGPLDGLVTGMALMYLCVNAVYLYMLVPIPGRNQSFADRMREWHEMTDLMTQRCDDSGPTVMQAAAIVVVLGGALVLNAVYALVPSRLVISVAIVLSAFAFGRVTAAAALDAAAGTRGAGTGSV